MILKIGRFISSPSRFLILVILGFVPVFVSCLYLYRENKKLALLEQKYVLLLEKSKQSYNARLKKKKFLEKYTQYDPYFLNNHIEKLEFSLEEQRYLRKILDHAVFGSNKTILKRKELLETKNYLSFREENIQTTPLIKETLEKQTNPIYADIFDIERLLSEIEGVRIGDFSPIQTSPQLIITRFVMNRKNHLGLGEIYEVKLDLLKREFLKKVAKKRSNEE